jgi:hypothetical protein
VRADASGARLRLDAPAVTYAADQAAAQAAARREEAMAAVRAAVGMAQAAANAASSRVALLEGSIEALKRESKANRDAMAALQQTLAQSDERGRWTPYLLAALLGMLGLTGWMYARMRRSEQERQKDWWNSSHGAPAGAAPATEPKVEAVKTAPATIAQVQDEAPARTAKPAARAKPVMTPAVGGLAIPQGEVSASAHETAPLPAGFVVPDSPLRDVKIEELLDIEQQAEFFIVLGQDEAAIDLLMGHLRSTGGASPLPYLKLLEIYHRRGDQTSYERMRRRFNERFNATAPEWATGLHSGRSLLDYPAVMERIEQSWPQPDVVMKQLEPLLFRTDTQDLFDLPAYRDVLFLFTLARDLKELAQEADGENVDLLLPLAAEGGDAVQDEPPGLALTLAPRSPKAAPVASAPVEPAPLPGISLDLPDITGVQSKGH